MKKILFGISVFLSALISAQNYPDSYPTTNTQNNNEYYGDEEDSYYFPDDYYYEYPSDYYTNDFYQSSYNDYRSSIYDVNWNRFFSRNRLSPWQIDQIIRLNESYSSYASWSSYYRYNPDRWYYDRFYALENILGPRIFIVFQNNYYNGYSPVVYYQNYRRQHYVTNIYVVPRYRNINVNRYRVDRAQYHQSNQSHNFGFSDTPRNGNGNWNNSGQNSGFRNDAAVPNIPRNNGFRNDNPNAQNTPRTESGGFRDNSDIKTNPNPAGSDSSIRNNSGTRTETTTTPRTNGGFRNNSDVTPPSNTPRSSGGFRNSDSGGRNAAPERKIESRSQEQRNPAPSRRSSGNSGFRFTNQ